MTRTARWMLRFALSLTTPVVVLGSLEGVLRIAGYGHDRHFARPCRVLDKPAVCADPEFPKMFFPPGLERTADGFAMLARKEPRTFRIVVLGESAAEGDPAPAYGFSRFLEAMLRDRYQGTRFEVVNAAATAISSHVILPIARQLADRDVDLFIVYAGNNEVVGPYGAGTVFAPPAASLGVIRAGIALRSTRTGQLIARLIGPRTVEKAQWKGMAMFLDRQLPADAHALARVYDDFRHNLADIVRAARRGGARVLVATVGVNLKDCPPFASMHRDGLRADQLDAWQARVNAGAAYEAAGDCARALGAYEAAAAIDDRYAELQFQLGRCHASLGDFAAAKRHFVAARDLDTLRFRADSRINEIIRGLPIEEGVEVLDVASAIEAGSPHGTPGEELFWEHVHPNPVGNYLIAAALLPAVERAIPAALRVYSEREDVPSRQGYEHALALTRWNRRLIVEEVLRRLAQPPFTGQSGREQRRTRLQAELAVPVESPQELEAIYEAAVARFPLDRWLRQGHSAVLRSHGKSARAAQEEALFKSDQK